MSLPAKYYLDEVIALRGAPNVTYPEGGATQWPRIERVYTVPKSAVSSQPTTLTDFPGSLLVVLSELKRDPQGVQLYVRYDTLPGPILVDTTVLANGVPILTAKQRRAATDILTEGELAPTSVNVTSIAVAAGGLTTVTLAGPHELCPRAWVLFVGTNSTPALASQTSGALTVGATYYLSSYAADDDFTNVGGTGNATGASFTATGTTPTTYSHGSVLSRLLQVVAVPAPNQVTVTFPITVAGTAAGAMAPRHRIIRELRASGTIVNVKMDSMLACPDPSTFNEAIACTKVYRFPNFLKSIKFYRDTGFSETSVIGSAVPQSSYSFGGTVNPQIRNGYRGPCPAVRHRFFFSGPPAALPIDPATGDPIAPTIIITSSGSVAIAGGSVSFKGYTGLYESESFSNNWRSQPIAGVLWDGTAMETIESTFATLNISSIGLGSFPIITTTTAHGLSEGFPVRINGSNSTPVIDGIYTVAGLGALNTQFQVAVPAPVTVAGTTAGTVDPAANAATSSAKARAFLDLPVSFPTKFTDGDKIWLFGQPQKLEAGLWELIAWQLTAPYTSGEDPP